MIIMNDNNINSNNDNNNNNLSNIIQNDEKFDNLFITEIYEKIIYKLFYFISLSQNLRKELSFIIHKRYDNRDNLCAL